MFFAILSPLILGGYQTHSVTLRTVFAVSPTYSSGLAVLHTVRMTWRSFPLVSRRDHSVNIFVGNLAYSATEHDLRQLFESYGAVDKVNVITDRDTGRSKGFGFVEMPDSAAAKAAIQGLQGTELGGRTLTVNEARPREPRREPSRSRW